MSFGAALGFYLFSLTALADHQWRLLYSSGDIEIRWGRQVIEEKVPEGLTAAWYWSAEVAPIRLEPDEIPRFRPQPTRERRSLRRISRLLDPRSPPAVLLSGPEKLWEEVPEHLLPHLPWPAASAELSFLAPSSLRWRTRYIGQNLGSFWVDLAPGQRQGLLPLAAAVDRAMVVVGPEGTNLSRATLVLSAPASRGGRILARFLGPDGVLEVPALPDSDEASLFVSARGGAPAVIRGFPSTWPPQIVLAAGVNIRGRFLDPNDRPLVGIEVVAEMPLAGGVSGYTSRKTRSDTSGVFLFENLNLGNLLLRTRGAKQGVWRSEVELKMADALRGELDLGPLRLGPPGRFEVLLRATSGEPVAGATIKAGKLPVAMTDEAGVALLAGVDPQQMLELMIEAPFFIPRDGIRFFPPHPPRVELRLEKAFYLRGSFLSKDRQPLLPGRAVAKLGNLTVFSDIKEGGSFEMLLPLEKAIELELTSRRGPRLLRVEERGQEGEIRDLGPLFPAAGAAFHGVLVAAADGQPVAGARIFMPRPGTEHPVIALDRGDLLETTSHADGTFVLSGLSPGQGLLRIDAAGFARHQLEISLPALTEAEGESLDLGRIELNAGTRLVVNAPGAKNGLVARLDLRGQWQEADFLQATVNEGIAIFPQVPRGQVLLTLHEGRRLLCEKKVEVPSDEELEVECRATPPRLQGVVTLGGERAPGGELHFLSAEGDQPQIIRHASTPGGLDRSRIVGGGRPQVNVVVLPDGSFKTEEVLAGEWQVAFSLEGGFSGPAIALSVPEAEEFVAQFDYPALSLNGRVVDLEQQPVDGAFVYERRQGLSTRSAADGSFRLFGVKAGPAALHAVKHGERSPSLEIEIPPDGDTGEITLVLGAEDKKGRLPVWITRDGQPAGGALVFLEGEGGVQHLLSADGQGRASFDLPAPRPARVRWGATFEGLLGLSDWTGWEEARQEGGRLELEPGGELILHGSQRAMPQIFSSSGWDIAWWLGRLGLRPIVLPGNPARIPGLRPGSTGS